MSKSTWIFLILIAPHALYAQRTWPMPGVDPFVAIEVGKALYRPFPATGGTGSVNPASYTVTLSARSPLTRSLALTVEVPFSRMTRTLTLTGPRTVTESGYSFGNPWVGIETSGGSNVSFEAGFRPGLLRPPAEGIERAVRYNGVTADYDHYEAWLAGRTSVRAMVRYDRQLDGVLFITATGGASLTLATGAEAMTSDLSKGPDLYALYGARVGARTSAITADVAFLGRYYPTVRGPKTEPMVNQVALELGGTAGGIQPNGSIRFYFDRLLRPRARATLSLGMSVFYAGKSVEK